MTIVKRYKCIKSNDEKRFAVGEIYPLYKGKITYVVANNGTKWYEDEFPLIERQYGVLLKLMDEQEKSAKCTYTPFEVNNVILRAYQLYDNDSQRLAYIKGYFAK